MSEPMFLQILEVGTYGCMPLEHEWPFKWIRSTGKGKSCASLTGVELKSWINNPIDLCRSNPHVKDTNQSGRLVRISARASWNGGVVVDLVVGHCTLVVGNVRTVLVLVVTRHCQSMDRVAIVIL
jgi:hypothetical protein